MNRSYTNHKDELMTVSKEHLDTAVAIKLELQKASPSRRCNWHQHKKLMKKEGFSDSSYNESYRCLIKHYQKSIGKLPSLKAHVEMVSSNKLNSIKEIVGELAWEKRENQNVLRELNKAKRDIIDEGILINEVKYAISNLEIRDVKESHINVIKDRSMLILPSDWHVGYKNEKYNHDTAIIEIDRYVDKILEYAKLFNINDFHLSHMGDITENIYMHKNTQAFNAEFTFSEQIVKSIELLVYLIVRLSCYGKVTFYGVVRGNHGRMSDKKETLSNDCAEYIIHEGVKSIINNSNNQNVSINDSEYNVERVMMTVQNHRIKVIHGDTESKNDTDKIQKHISLENEIIDILCLGHFHNFQIKTENHNRMVFTSGCLQGSTEYGKSLKYDTVASQGIIVLSNNEITPININLQ